MTNNFDSDISLKELFVQIGEYLTLLRQSWKTILFAGIVAAVVFGIIHVNDGRQYKAELTFMLNEDEGGALGSLSGLLGQFGLAGSSTKSNLDKIMELSRARKITQNALFEKVSINGNDDFLANHLIGSLQNQDVWTDNGFLAFFSSGDSLNIDDFRFSHSDVDQFTDKENKALKKLHGILTGSSEGRNLKAGGIFKSSYSELTGIMSFSVVTDHQDLSILTVNKFFENLSSYYIDKSTEKQKYDYGIIKSKYDSLVNRLNTVQYELANFQDSNFKVFRKQDLLSEKKLKMEEQKLALMLGEAEKQVQLAALTLDNKTPYIQLIDAPIKPLRPANKSVLYYFILGGILGGLLCVLWLAARKMYRDIMNS